MEVRRSQLNRSYVRLKFDSDLSAEYNTKPWQIKISRQVSNALQQRKDWIGARWTGTDDTGRDSRLLDYACGTGSITNALAPYVDTIRGIDVSENMVQKYNEAARQSGMTSDHCNAVVGDLFAETVPEHLTVPDLYMFDIAVIGLGFHHFENPALAVKRLTERLKPGDGVLVIVDFLPFSKDNHSSGAHHTIKTHGFNEEAMAKMYKDAGLDRFDFAILPEPVAMEFESGTKHRSVFIARGKRAKNAWGKLTQWVGEIQNTAGSQVNVAPVGGSPALGYDSMGKKIEASDADPAEPRPRVQRDKWGRKIVEEQ